MARYMAKNIVASGLAERCEIELAYAIGVAEPVSVLCETFGTGKTDNERLTQAVRRAFDMRPEAITAGWICAVQYIPPRRRTGISAEPMSICLGSAPI